MTAEDLARNLREKAERLRRMGLLVLDQRVRSEIDKMVEELERQADAVDTQAAAPDGGAKA